MPPSLSYAKQSFVDSHHRVPQFAQRKPRSRFARSFRGHSARRRQSEGSAVVPAQRHHYRAGLGHWRRWDRLQSALNAQSAKQRRILVRPACRTAPANVHERRSHIHISAVHPVQSQTGTENGRSLRLNDNRRPKSPSCPTIGPNPNLHTILLYRFIQISIYTIIDQFCSPHTCNERAKHCCDIFIERFVLCFCVCFPIFRIGLDIQFNSQLLQVVTLRVSNNHI